MISDNFANHIDRKIPTVKVRKNCCEQDIMVEITQNHWILSHTH